MLGVVSDGNRRTQVGRAGKNCLVIAEESGLCHCLSKGKGQKKFRFLRGKRETGNRVR